MRFIVVCIFPIREVLETVLEPTLPVHTFGGFMDYEIRNGKKCRKRAQKKRKYPIDRIPIGGYMILPWPGGCWPEDMTKPKNLKSIQVAVRAYSKKTGREFDCAATWVGMKVTRIK